MEVEEADSMEQPEESEQPEKEILRICKSRGLGDFRRVLKPLRTCIVDVV